MKQDQDPADIAMAALEGMVDELADVRGLPMFDVLAGLNAEIIRQMLCHMGFQDTEKFLRVNLDTVAQLADDAAQNRKPDLVTMLAIGTA